MSQSHYTIDMCIHFCPNAKKVSKISAKSHRQIMMAVYALVYSSRKKGNNIADVKYPARGILCNLLQTPLGKQNRMKWKHHITLLHQLSSCRGHVLQLRQWWERSHGASKQSFVWMIISQHSNKSTNFRSFRAPNKRFFINLQVKARMTTLCGRQVYDGYYPVKKSWNQCLVFPCRF